jgi:hypothetical protein
MRRFATVTTAALRVRNEPGGAEVTADYALMKGDRLEILDGPDDRKQFRWWKIRANKTGRTPVEGWVAEGPGGVWLRVESEYNPPVPPPPDYGSPVWPSPAPRPPQDDNFASVPANPPAEHYSWAWVAVGGALAVIVLILWLF